MLAIAIFWAALGLLAYAHVGYPLVALAWARLWPRAPAPRRGAEPSVSVLVVAQDEAPRIGARIENLLALDYPKDRLEILVASDGSVDGTVAQARAHAGRNVQVFPYAAARGKPAVLSELAKVARGKILVMADARQRFEPRSLRALVAPFADPKVGAVSGELLLDDAGPGASPVSGAVGAYWRYEKLLRRCESQIDSTIGVTGAIYAIRRSLFAPIAADTLLDDVLIPMRAVRRGYRVVFALGARAHDRPPGSAEQEFNRKVRTLAGNFQLFLREPWLLNPLENRVWLQTVSHKLLRLLCPLFLACLFAANLWLLARPLGRLALAGQLAFYAAALCGRALRGRPEAARSLPGLHRLVTVPYVFCLLHLATVVGLFRLATGQVAVTWKRRPLRIRASTFRS